MGRPDSLSDPRRHCHPAGCPVLAASARASLSARSGRCRQYDSTARRWVAGIRGCLSACDRTHAGKDAESRFSSRLSALWFFSSRQVDIPKQPSRVHAIGAIATMPAKGNWAREALRPASYLGAAMGDFADRRSIHCWTPKTSIRCFPIPTSGFFPMAPQLKREHTAAH